MTLGYAFSSGMLQHEYINIKKHAGSIEGNPSGRVNMEIKTRKYSRAKAKWSLRSQAPAHPEALHFNIFHIEEQIWIKMYITKTFTDIILVIWLLYPAITAVSTNKLWTHLINFYCKLIWSTCCHTVSGYTFNISFHLKLSFHPL